MDMELEDCRERILSNQYQDIILDFEASPSFVFPGIREELDYCEDVLEENLRIIHINTSQVPSWYTLESRYQYIPKCFGLLQDNMMTDTPAQIPAAISSIPDLTALSAAGILAVSGPPLELTGREVIIGIIDTGIRYQLPAFRRSDGSTRILSVWDQTNQEGQVPDGFYYGTEFREEDINRNLESGAPLLTVDEIGHGTEVAGVAGGYDRNSGFLGAAPDASFVVVKLKQAKEYLRNFYQIPPDVPCYQETDIMMALKYLEQFAVALKSPIATCLALGSTMGAHDGTSILAGYMNDLARRRSHCIVVGGGNEGNAGGHYEGNLVTPPGGGMAYEDVELLVGREEQGFWLELWGQIPGNYTVSITSPSGESTSEIPYRIGQSANFTFIYSNTRITVEYVLVEHQNGQQLIAMKFQNPLPGIWRIRVNMRGNGGRFHMWLPMRNFLEGDTYFLRPSPYHTLTEPAYGRDILSVSTYNSTDGSFYLNSGRGFSTDGLVVPALAAPGVGIPTPIMPDTGSSMSAAITTGAAACFLQWAVIEGNDLLVNTSSVKNYLIRGAERRSDIYYPSREWGYGTLNLAGVFEALAGI